MVSIKIGNYYRLVSITLLGILRNYTRFLIYYLKNILLPVIAITVISELLIVASLTIFYKPDPSGEDWGRFFIWAIGSILIIIISLLLVHSRKLYLLYKSNNPQKNKLIFLIFVHSVVIFVIIPLVYYQNVSDKKRHYNTLVQETINKYKNSVTFTDYSEKFVLNQEGQAYKKLLINLTVNTEFEGKYKIAGQLYSCKTCEIDYIAYINDQKSLGPFNTFEQFMYLPKNQSKMELVFYIEKIKVNQVDFLEQKEQQIQFSISLYVRRHDKINKEDWEFDVVPAEKPIIWETKRYNQDDLFNK